MAGFPLTGVDPLDPTPGIIREIQFAQGLVSGSSNERTVLIYGNKTSAGSETADTLDTANPIQSLDDCYARFGRRSEWAWMYRMFTAVPQSATIYGIAVAENGSGTAASCTFTFATTATGTTNLIVEWGGYQISVPVTTGDTAIVQAAAVTAKINSWEEGTMPFTAEQGAPTDDHIVTVTTANLGPRQGLVIDKPLRMYYQKSVATTVTKSAITAGTNADDYVNAYALAANAGPFYYQINPGHTTSAPTSTDNGVGEGAAMILSQALPSGGKGQQMIFGFVGTNAQLVTVCNALNNVRVKMWWSENSVWTPGMIAAHYCAIQRLRELAHPGANLTGYTASDTFVLLHPPPYDANDRPSATEIRTALNNGGSVITWNGIGKASIKRCITTRSLNGSVTDYRAREGHIPSVADYFWDVFLARHVATVQGLVAADPLQGQKPLAGVQYPSATATLMRDVITDLAGPFIAGSPVLDPGSLAGMLASVVVLPLNDGLSITASPIAVRHNNKTQALIRESSPAY